GLMFVGVVMYAPWGLGGLILMHHPLLAAGQLRRVVPAYALAVGPAVLLGAGGIGLVETTHHLLVNSAQGPAMRVLGIGYDATSPLAWVVIAALLAAGVWLLLRVAPLVSSAYLEAAQAAHTPGSRQ
ncbi:MAG TPA: branched-chain amino acid ABC transporter permease, partial [Burkholderiaceae bacterium]|nr:branched-chain amino acid ABC transporter permease [Burkholderiaceae bacterium]